MREQVVQSPNRALEFAVIGLGQAGGNLAAEFYRRGYEALAVNTARSDLQALSPGGLYPPLPEEQQLYIGLENCDGAGSDTEYTKECIEAHSQEIKVAAENVSQGMDILFIAAGLGGGTGSAAATFIEALSDLDIPIVGLFTLPNDTESAVVKINAIRAASEIVEISLSGRIFIDNASVENTTADISIQEYYPTINSKIVAPLDELNHLNHRDYLLSIRNFDGEDLRKLLLGTGVLNYSVVEIPNITVDEIVGALSDSLLASDLMPPGFNSKSISFIGLVIEAPESVFKKTTGDTFSQIDEKIKSETKGGVLYRGLYQTTDKHTKLRLIVSCKDLPERLNEVLEAARSEGEVLQEKLASQLPQLRLNEINNFALFPDESKNRASERPRVSSKLPRPVSKPSDSSIAPKASRKPNRRRRPAPGKRRAPERKNSNPNESEENEFATKEHPTSSPAAINDIIPGPTQQDIGLDSEENATKYDQLVADYLHAKKKAERGAIAEQLEKDSISALTVIRYYAVDAMCRLGGKEFKDALLAASEDENDAIRDLALDALSP